MDVMQTARMIEWLDEERRRDKSTISQLEARSREQQDVIDQLKRQLNGLENELSAQRSQFMPINREPELLEIFRKEFGDIIEGMESKRLTAERELERRQELARENLMNPVRNLETELEKFKETMKEFSGARAERERISAAMVALQQRVEDLNKQIEVPTRRIDLLEEQRRQDTRRLSEIQTTLPELSKSLEQSATRLELIEGLTRSNEKRIIETQNADSNRREEMQQFLDQQNLIAQQREQQLNEIKQQVSQYDDDIRRNLERFEAWADTHRQMRKIVGDFERIGDRLERRINEVAEMQRLSEERFRTEWNDWIDEDQLRWKEFTVNNDEAWRIHNKEQQELRATLDTLRETLAPLEKSLERVWRLQRAQAELYRDRYQAMLLEYDTPEKPTVASNPNGGTA